ncbi:MAG: antirestriction protein ArdA [[Clostridium] innocuum]
MEAQDPIFSIALHRLADDAEVWLDLPAGDKEIEDTMRSLGIAKTEEGGWYREAFDIPNHDGYPFYRIDPHEDIMTLNVLAKQLSMLNERQLAGLICYADTKDIFQNEALTILSLHADDIPYFTYDHELMQSDVINDISLEERYGMTKAIDTGLMKKLDELQIITYFDFKSYGYGDICNGRVTLYEEGFIDDTIRVSLPETFTEAQVMITDAYEHRYSIAGTDPVSAERLCADIDKLIHRYPDIRNLHYDLSSDHMSFLYEDRSVDVSLSDILERKNGFEQFLVLQPGETNEGCLERSYRKLVAMSDLLEEEQELFLERKEDIRIAGISI